MSDLLGEATRYGERFKNVPVGVMVLDLIERVRQAEALKNDYAQQYEDAVDARVAAMNERDDKARDGRLRLAAAERERDAAREDCNKNASNVRRLTLELHEARGKLDKARRLIDEWGKEPGFASLRAEALAILDGTGTTK